MTSAPTDRPQRVLFYSHDTLGLGHLQRTMLLCGELGRRCENLSILIVTGSAMAHRFRMPPGTDYVKLPSVIKVDNEVYTSRGWGVPFEQVLNARREIIFQTTKEYEPDFLFVDTVPLGMKGELRKTLAHIRENLPATQIFLSLRDIVDSASHVIPLWRRLGVFEALEQYYDRIFIFGQPLIFDPLAEYRVPDPIRHRARFCGYIFREADQDRSRAIRRQLRLGDQKLIVVTVGGGSDGAFVVENYLKALSLIGKEIPLFSVVVLGPEMDRKQARRFVCGPQPSPVWFMEFCNDTLSHIGAADLVVSMGGFNAISEILSLRKRAIVIPRVRPRSEQLIRSERLRQLGLLHMIHPEELTAETLADEIRACLQSDEPSPTGTLDFEGLNRFGDEMQLLLNGLVKEDRPTTVSKAVR